MREAVQGARVPDLFTEPLTSERFSTHCPDDVAADSSRHMARCQHCCRKSIVRDDYKLRVAHRRQNEHSVAS